MERGPLTDQELEVLSVVAMKRDEHLAIRFIEEGVKEPRFVRRLESRSEYAIHAAVGLDLQKREEVQRILLEQLQSPGVSAESRKDLALALASFGELSPLASSAAARALTQAMTQKTDPSDLRALADGLSMVAPWLESKEAHVVCTAAAAILIQAMTEATDHDALHILADGLLAVAARLDNSPHLRQ
jgi:hypothetical protein